MGRERTVTVYTREGCHLCGDAIETVRRVSDSVNHDVSLDIVDVDTDPELQERYGERVPYVLVDGRPRFKYRVDEDEFRDHLTGE
ncbi:MULTISPECIES: glutaredoxin family protein [unclassified Haladaptatus]|uniref:glutaredoxin family protein n=1 Tax=unclassified Haladaptatus TaxID=2622732 RepID=UPI00209BE3B4|nr:MULTISPECIES: glutaredoxin family protein [unclassified Haladaptatus]MCO8244297.1 glutaredoxin family protein [Haladaptatus sp. AB643]MCO8254079.1 glutaredoxin family protein [Haladaptatus sp. AB618]